MRFETRRRPTQLQVNNTFLNQNYIMCQHSPVKTRSWRTKRPPLPVPTGRAQLAGPLATWIPRRFTFYYIFGTRLEWVNDMFVDVAKCRAIILVGIQTFLAFHSFYFVFDAIFGTQSIRMSSSTKDEVRDRMCLMLTCPASYRIVIAYTRWGIYCSVNKLNQYGIY